jgi:hypothetical protein
MLHVSRKKQVELLPIMKTNNNPVSCIQLLAFKQHMNNQASLCLPDHTNIIGFQLNDFGDDLTMLYK